MINRVVFFSLLLIIVASCNKSVSDSFVLEGSIEGGKTLDSIYLNYYSLQNNEWYEICDTAKIIDGKFIFKGKLEGLTLAYLNFDSKGIELYIEPCSMKLNIDAKQPYTYGLSGTGVDKENEEIKKAVGSYERLMDEKSNVMVDLINEFNRINQMQLPDNSSIIDSLLNIIHSNSAEMILLNKEKHKVYIDFASKHKSYKISPALLYRASKFDFVGKDTILSVYNSLSENLKTSLMGKLAIDRFYNRGKLLVPWWVI
ncbi:DUF4369 domain-containing protein [Dysgonomonas sp. Marseille-P4677]|uniref:DUF4369 domain-containing protein n=1 Tax=Dysgonomonas sp. Marseille-P4677 TaxID=2364790 RepID=UPI001912BDD2|nr:DUF4369 domain-containing protein [Dysgonomonas sp. Marseille-P4677]MBK5720734.1 DUF4369 domain-containing protein [Dysgonomonas sp. Marseille-P4677]